MSNPLIRNFVEKATEKSFDRGLFWGVVTGVFTTHFYKEDQYRKLQTKYYTLKEKLLTEQILKLH